MLSVTQNTKVESTFLHFNWLQVWLLNCPHLLLATGVSKYKLQEHHMLEKQLFLQFWQGANHFVQSIFELFVKVYQGWHFFSFCVCCCSANRNNKHVNTNIFAIRTIFWHNCKGADIFGHDCVYTKTSTKIKKKTGHLQTNSKCD